MSDLAMLSDLVMPWAIRVAVTLEVPDALDADPMSAEDLARGLEVDPAGLTRLLRCLACHGVFTETSPGVFGHNMLSRQLRHDGPSGMIQWLDLRWMAHRMQRATTEGLLYSVRTGQPAYPEIFGRPLWTDAIEEPHLADSFDRLMYSHDSLWMPDVVGYCWDGVDHVVDLGGGSGRLVAQLLAQWPELTGTVVDLPPSAAAAEKLFADRQLTERATAVGQSFFDPLPRSGAYLLAQVLHNWNDEAAKSILHRCREAVIGRGRIFVVERAFEGNSDDQDIALADLRMLTIFGGRERSLREFHQLAEETGWAENRTTRIQSGFYVLEYAAM